MRRSHPREDLSEECLGENRSTKLSLGTGLICLSNREKARVSGAVSAWKMIRDEVEEQAGRGNVDPCGSSWGNQTLSKCVEKLSCILSGRMACPFYIYKKM